MKTHGFLVLVASTLVAAACGEAPTGPKGPNLVVEPSLDVGPTLSNGCNDLENNVTGTWDGLYTGNFLSGRSFFAGEVVSFSAGGPSAGPPSYDSLVVDGPSRRQLTTPFPSTLAYTIPTDDTYYLYWGTYPAGTQATWDVSCSHPIAAPKVSIEITPGGGGTNAISSKSKGLVPVAILGDPSFALTDIDWTTLAFGPAGAAVAHDLSNPETWSTHVMDVNGDGILDLVTHYSQKDTGLTESDTEACLTGMVAGFSISACGPVTVR